MSTRPPVGTQLTPGLEINQNLVAAYLMNAGAGRQLWDSCGTYHLNSNYIATWQSDGMGPCIYSGNSINGGFTSINQLSVPANGSISMTCWATATAIISTAHSLLCMGTYNTPTGLGLRMTSSNQMKVWWNYGGAGAAVTDTLTLAANQLHFWGLTIGPNSAGTITGNLYRDGNLVATGTAAALVAVSSVLYIGGNSTDASYWYGRVSLAQVWLGRMLQPSDMLALYQQPYLSWSKPLRRNWMSSSSGVYYSIPRSIQVVRLWQPPSE